MMISCFATAHYLNKHTKSLSASDQSLSNPQLHSQIRVTVTGILQGVICFLYVMWNLLDVMSYFLSPFFYFDTNITSAVDNLYTLGTTVNLGVGQTQGKASACLEGGQKKTLHWEVIEGSKTSWKSGDNDIDLYHRKLWY